MKSGSRGTATPPTKILGVDQLLCFALYSTGLAMDKVYRKVLAPLSLTYPQYLVMLVLWQADGITVTEVGDQLGLDSATLTPLLKRLEHGELVTRRRAAEDERRVLISLTPSGRALKQKAAGVQLAILHATQCSVSELAGLQKQLEQLRARLRSSA